MDFQEALTVAEQIMPAVIGGTLVLLALLGAKELLKEAAVAFKKGARA